MALSFSKYCASSAVISHSMRPFLTFTRWKFRMCCATSGSSSMPSSSSERGVRSRTLRRTWYPMPARATATTTSKPARSRDLRMGAPRCRELPWGGRGVKVGCSGRLPVRRLAPPALVPPHPFGRCPPDRGLDRRREACGQLDDLTAPAPGGIDALERDQVPARCAALDEHRYDGR